jgi:hypothetical protein
MAQPLRKWLRKGHQKPHSYHSHLREQAIVGQRPARDRAQETRCDQCGPR